MSVASVSAAHRKEIGGRGCEDTGSQERHSTRKIRVLHIVEAMTVTAIIATG